MTPLQEAILRAHEDGDYAELRRLQALYRASAVLSSGDRGYVGTARVVERTPPARTSATTTSPSRTRPPNPQESRHAGSAPLPVVRVSEGARTTMADRCFDRRRDIISGFEPGGILYGTGTSVAFAGTSGSSGDHSVEIDFAAARDEERRFGHPLCGDWHCHVGRPSPSREDLLGWMDACRVRGAPHVGLLLHSESLDWDDATMRAWVAFRRDRRIFVEPAHIHEGGT